MNHSEPRNQTQNPAHRAYALDALRGFAILAMLLSGQLPFDKNALPAWMYHAQVPPPNFEWNPNVYGITWVDLVFPFFLFSMGAAFPLAFSRRMEQGASAWKLSLFVLERGFLLGFFALYVEAIRPNILSHHPTAAIWWLALLGFFLLFPISNTIAALMACRAELGDQSSGLAWRDTFSRVGKIS